mmetsp:Transcript_4297/g.10936  ORF Transcript_4297/g.10936 Transcript_4297/m.10936 type:complete len:241 (-) Transcript_4297:152-874(-)
MMMTKRYFKVPISPEDGAFGFDSGDRTTMGYWLAEFDGQSTVRQLELHPRKPPVLLETGSEHICPHTLDDTNLCAKPHLEIMQPEFDEEWDNAMVMAASEAKAAAAENGTDEAGAAREHDPSPDEPLPTLPTPTPSPDGDDTTADAAANAAPAANADKTKRPPTRPAPAPPAQSGGDTPSYAHFRELLLKVASGTAAGGDAYGTLWSRGAKVLASLGDTDSFDKEHFTEFLYRELLALDE